MRHENYVLKMFSRYKDYTEVFGVRRYCLETDDITYTLAIKDVELKDGGDIECQAKNKYGTVSIRAKLHVLGESVTIDYGDTELFIPHTCFNVVHVSHIVLNDQVKISNI